MVGEVIPIITDLPLCQVPVQPLAGEHVVQQGGATVVGAEVVEQLSLKKRNYCAYCEESMKLSGITSHAIMIQT